MLISPPMNENATTTLWLREGRERSVLNRHPWIFSGALAHVEGPGGESPVVADVRSSEGEWLARGFHHPGADLAVRIFTWDEEQPLDAALLEGRVDRALALREEARPARAAAGETDSWRLVFSEADGLSGLIVDRYADTLSVRVSARALLPYLPGLLERLRTLTGLTRFHVEAEPDAVEREGLSAGAVEAHSTPDLGRIRIREDGLQFEVDFGAAQKTGFYLDQRDNRRRAAAYARGRRVLSAYCYTGAFEVHAARAGATETLGLDSSEPALEQARAHHTLNGLTVPAVYEKADVPQALRRFRDEARTFDLIVLDPPRFVFNRAQKDKGLRAYKDINLLAMKLLTPGGVLASFSCSGLVSMADFKETFRWAAVDSGRDVRILEQLGQPFDHPILATFPESEYLKGLIARVG